MKTHVLDHSSLHNLLRQSRQKFQRLPRWLHKLCYQSQQATKPEWLRRRDPLREVFAQQELLLNHGKIVWGSVVQASKPLYEAGQEDLPAQVVFSEYPMFERHPQELSKIADCLYELKGMQTDNKEIARFAEMMSNGLDRVFSAALPKAITRQNGFDVYTSVLMVFRKHLPQGVLHNGVLPLLIHQSTPVVMILPQVFWPEALRQAWLELEL